MPARLIRLRYPATCVGCSLALPPKAQAWWDTESKSALCESCGAPPSADVAATVVTAPADRSGRVSTAGGSAQRKYERLKAKREADIRSRYGRFAGVKLALSSEPQSTRAWAKGAEGERRLGARLNEIATDGGFATLHDRRIPGSRANIDHLVVTPSGVWVIDAKRYSGQIARRDKGGWFRTDIRLYVGGRDRTKLVAGMASQVAAVREVLGADWRDVPVRPVLCFIGTEWGWFSKPFELDGVLVTWPKAMYKRLVQPGAYTAEGVELIAAQLSSRLRPAV